MQLFVNSATVAQVQEASDWGILDGVTTNPTLTGALKTDYRENLLAICRIMGERTVCAQVMSTRLDDMVTEAVALSDLHPSILPKIHFSIEGIKAVGVLARDGRGVNVTGIFTVGQALLAAKAGAAVVSLFTGPLGADVQESVNLVEPTRRIFDNYGFSTRILDCVRSPREAMLAAQAGANICTMNFEYLKQLFHSPYTEKRWQIFKSDWQAAYGDKTWLSP